MLNWLKKKTKLSFQSNYINNLRRHTHNNADMFLTEQNIFNPQENNVNKILKIFVYGEDGEQYSLDVPQEMTLEKILMMSVGHFYGMLEAVGGGESSDMEVNDGRLMKKDTYRLVLTRDMRTLDTEKSIISEGLVNCDELLLIKCRISNIITKNVPNSSFGEVTPESISLETCNVIPQNMDREANPINTNLDFKIAFKQILLTMIEVSIHLISSEDNAGDIFVFVFEQLEKRHKPSVDKNSLKQLTDMGFTEARAIKALQLKKNFQDAMEWLLEELGQQLSGSEEENGILLLSSDERKKYFLSDNDPAVKVMREFNNYIEKWFSPDRKALQNLVDLDYGEDLAKEALRMWCNNENVAKEFLDGNSKLVETAQKGFDRNSPIMSAILDSPVVQVALSKPKTLFALMVLCETPGNINVWLSDPETHPVVSQILRIYHAEKYRLGYEIENSESQMLNTSLEESDSAMAIADDINFTEAKDLPLLNINKNIPNVPSMPKGSLSNFL